MFMVYHKHATRKEPVEILAFGVSYERALQVLTELRAAANEPTMPNRTERRRSNFDFDILTTRMS
jgi:hypothetical protein